MPTDDLVKVETLANEQVISDAPVTHVEMSKSEAEARGAIAFFGEKYGDRVRVLEAGPSIELCGGTHVDSLGFIGPIKIVSEGSIGSNVRRIEALTGDGSLAYIADEEARLRRIAAQLRATPAEVEERVTRLQSQLRELESELRALRAEQATAGRGRARRAGRRRRASSHGATVPRPTSCASSRRPCSPRCRTGAASSRSSAPAPTARRRRSSWR